MPLDRGSFADVPRTCVVSGCEDFIVPEGLGCSCDLGCVPDAPGVALALSCVDPSPDPIACRCLADGVEFRSFEGEVGGVGAPDCSAYQARCFPEP